MDNETYKRLKRKCSILFTILVISIVVTVVLSINAVFMIMEILK